MLRAPRVTVAEKLAAHVRRRRVGCAKQPQGHNIEQVTPLALFIRFQGCARRFNSKRRFGSLLHSLNKTVNIEARNRNAKVRKP